jgi:cytochrome c-type biogenesis protein CcmH/NrfG
LMTTGQDAAAVASFRRALTIRGDHVSALSGLGWVLATSADPGQRNPKEALAASQLAAQLSGGADPAVMDTLAAALASTGDFAGAVSAAEAAVEIANRLGTAALAEQIRDRLAVYRRGQPYRR